ncbi:MAG: tetratricopeptide repeat-containing protein [Bacteroidetes bacterium]|nr:tetratricopeptide repeat-containing protein [Bacteroidota bacterium]
MITSSSIQYISQVLSEPSHISDADRESIDTLIQTYPYFTPARYLDAANKHQKKQFATDMMSDMQLYRGNWLLYCEFLKAAGGADVTNDDNSAIVESGEEKIVVHHTPVVQDQTDEGFVIPESYNKNESEPLYKEINKAQTIQPETDESFILPVYTEDYFLHQGMHVSNTLPTDLNTGEDEDAEGKQLMVMLSFSEWLTYFQTRKQKEAEETEGQKSVKTMWQKEKLAAALEEENEEIPEKVFEMAVNSITKEDDLASESLAEVHVKQGRYDKAIEMYRKLSLRNPQKKAYFARKIEIILKEKDS